jgi:hypothetical protein
MSISPIIIQDTEVRYFRRPPQAQDDLVWVRRTFEEELACRARRTSPKGLRRGALLVTIALALAGGLVFLFSWLTPVKHTPIGIYGKTIVRDRKYETDVARLILDWRNFREQVVVIKGDVQCEADNCWFVPPPNLDKFVAIDIFMLPLEVRRHLALDCHVSQCSMVVTGRVPYSDDDMLIADEISDDRR